MERNSLFSLIQTVITIVCMFLSYRFLISAYGLEALGLWALLMVFGGATTTFDISGAYALARSVARHEIEFSDVTRAEVVHTVLITSLAINAGLTVLLLTALPFALPYFIGPDLMDEARDLLPWIAALMVSAPLAVGVSASIDGVMRADQRAILASVAAVLGLVVAAAVIPQHGVVGLAIARIAQQIVTICGGWLILRGHVDRLGWFPTRWRASISRRTTGYALKLNSIGALAMLLDPFNKFCINFVGGPAAVGVYELAARLAMHVRSLVTAATTPLLPAFAALDVSGDEFRNLLLKVQRIALPASALVALSSLVAAPLMCLIILGHISSDVLKTSALLSFGWSVNLFALPLYITAQAQGYLRWNLLSYVVAGTLVGLATFLLVPFWGEQGVVAGVAMGLALGAVVNIAGNMFAFGQSSVLRQSAPLMVATAAVVTVICALTWFLADALAGYGAS